MSLYCSLRLMYIGRTELGTLNTVRLGGEGDTSNGPTMIELVASGGPIAAGDEVFISYGSGQPLTPDESLLHYGFVDLLPGIQPDASPCSTLRQHFCPGATQSNANVHASGSGR